MAHFYGILEGGRGEVTRCGTKGSGLRTIAASWQGCVVVDLYEKDGTDYATVRLRPWKGSSGPYLSLYSGPVRPLDSKDKEPSRNTDPLTVRA